MTKTISLHAGILERVFYNDIYIKVLDVHTEFAKNENLEELCSIEVVDTQDLKNRPSTVTRQRRGRMIESGTAMALNRSMAVTIFHSKQVLFSLTRLSYCRISRAQKLPSQKTGENEKTSH